MILTDYYKIEHLPGTKSKSRMDCVASTKSYNPLEEKRSPKAARKTEKRDGYNIGDLFCHLSKVQDTSFNGDVKRKADLALTKTKNISSIFVPNIQSNFGYSDMVGTTDALIFNLQGIDIKDGKPTEGGYIEVFVARGYAKNCMALYNEVVDGLLDYEMSQLRAKAVNEKSDTDTPNNEG